MISPLLSDALRVRAEKGHWRERWVLTREGSPACVNFCSNDYLNLSQHPAVHAAAQAAMARYGMGSQGSPLVCGYTDAHAECESAFAQALGFDRAIVFSSGFAANLAVITTLGLADTALFLDKLNHASLIDAARQSASRWWRYPHRDEAALAAGLARTAADARLIISDSVFSMDGDVCDAMALTQIARDHQASVMLDDAHGFGVLGDTGLGILQATGLTQVQVPLLCIPFGKALGGSGAVVLMTEALYNSLLQFARPYIYSTAIPPLLCAAATQSLALIRQGELTRDLHRNIAYFQQCAAAHGLPLLPSDTAIQPLLLRDASLTAQVSQRLHENGFFIRAMCPPTVPLNGARLRITITTAQSFQQIEQLCEELHRQLISATGADNESLIS